MLDIFNGDAFSVTSLTDALRDVAHRPSRLGDMGLFQAEGVSTLSVAIERVGDTLQLVAPSARGSAGETRDEDKRTIEDIRIPHFQRDWSVMADEVQGIRAFGSETVLETIQGKVAKKIGANIADLDLTDEYSRIGAIQGIVSYKGGQTLNLFQKFGVAQPAEQAWNVSAQVDGALRKKCTALIRAVRAALGGIHFDYVHAFVGDNFFDDVLTNAEVRETYKNTSEAAFLRDSYVGKNRGSNPIFEFGGIVFENYGAIAAQGDGALMGIATDLAKFVPMGVDGLFRTYWAPADYIETVNTIGLQNYAKQWPMPNGKGIQGETQSNPLHICTRPGALLRAKRGA